MTEPAALREGEPANLGFWLRGRLWAGEEGPGDPRLSSFSTFGYEQRQETGDQGQGREEGLGPLRGLLSLNQDLQAASCLHQDLPGSAGHSGHSAGRSAGTRGHKGSYGARKWGGARMGGVTRYRKGHTGLGPEAGWKSSSCWRVMDSNPPFGQHGCQQRAPATVGMPDHQPRPSGTMAP